MQKSDINDGVQIQWRAGRIVEYHGDTARYGEVARQYEGGPCWQTGWQEGRLLVQLRSKDLPRGYRKQSRHWQKGQIACVGIVPSGGETVAEFRPDDIEERNGVLQCMVESFIWEIKFPADEAQPSASDSTYPPPSGNR